ncbi:hypothetical protein ABBQ32_14212 [Trebouxia sp. C0010 RCD-2024]
MQMRPTTPLQRHKLHSEQQNNGNSQIISVRCKAKFQQAKLPCLPYDSRRAPQDRPTSQTMCCHGKRGLFSPETVVQSQNLPRLRCLNYHNCSTHRCSTLLDDTHSFIIGGSVSVHYRQLSYSARTMEVQYRKRLMND